MRVVKTILCLVIGISILSGCGESSNEPQNEDSVTNVTVLEGTWAGACSDFFDGNFTGKWQWVEHYTGDNYQAFYSVYDATDCDGMYAVQKEMLGTFVIGNSMMTNSGVTAYSIDLAINQESVDEQITGIDISSYGFNAGQHWYDIFYLDGNTVYYGDFNTGNSSSVDERPTDIDFTAAYNKQ
jgi:hypothetical protein